MDINTIKSLIQVVSKSNIIEIKIQIGETNIYIKNSKLKNKNNYPLSNEFIAISRKNENKKKIINNLKNKFITIKSPMIGTFYRKPHPDKKPFVEIGDRIKIGMKLCVIEAMKLFNDIESEVNGKLVKILVKDSTPVDYDQPLFLLDPNH